MEPTRSASPRRSRRVRARRPPATDQQVSTALGEIRRIIGVEAKPIGTMLPEAIAEATEERGAALSAALEPSVTKTIRVVASRDSEWFGEILAPAIGAAVRKAVAAAFAQLMQRFNATLERSLSIHSIRWRLEARRTGRPFAEIVLLRTLIYRVEQVFLIHGDTGLVLQHLVAEGAPAADPDQVASMLAAIDAFGREAFESNPSGGYLHEFALGDVTVWIDRGPSVAVAVVIRGLAPRTLRDVLAETRERILLEHREEVTDFVADTTPFDATRPLLEQCLLAQQAEPPHRAPVILMTLLAGLVMLLGALLVSGHSRHETEVRQLEAYREVLEAEPGIVVTSAAKAGDQYRVRGFRDPVAPAPAALLTTVGLPPPELAFEPFYSLDPRIIEKRFRKLTTPPPSVSVEVAGGTLHLAGDAPQVWIDRALPLASAMPGVDHVDARVADPVARDLEDATRVLEAAQIHFQRGSALLEPEHRLVMKQVVELITRVRRLSAERGLTTCVVVIGDADPTGTPRRNMELANGRAAAVLAALQERDRALPSDSIRASARSPTDAGERTPSVRFRVHTGPPAPEGGCQRGERW